MKCLLDTNVLSEARKPVPNEQGMSWLYAQPISETHLSVISLGELEEGIASLGETHRAQELRVWQARLVESFRGRILDVDHGVVTTWGRIRAEAKRRGHTSPAIDALIAATALVHDLALVTRNVSDVEMLPVKVFNPWSER